MKLAGQARFARTPSDAGYAMAALLVAMSIVAVMMTVAMPVWKQATQREKEEELVFRGLQYAHAIQLYGRKFANSQPPNFDVLVQQRFLRKKYKDPITNDDFQPVTANQPAPGAAGASGATGGRGSGASPGPSTTPGSGSGASSGAPSTSAAPQSGRGMTPIGTPGSQPAGGIIGVTSKSKDKSIRLYNGRSHYNEWLFVYQPQQQTPGGGVPGASVPGRGTGRNTNLPGGGGFGGIGGGRGGGGQRGRGGQGGERGGPGGPFGPGGNRGFGPSGPAFPSPTPATPTGGGGRRD